MKNFSSKLWLFSLVLMLSSLTYFSRPTTVAAEDCGGPVPPAPVKVWARSGPMSGEVTLYWDKAAYANRYAVAYGTMSDKYMYGANNIGNANSTSYTVKSLSPGSKYYFRLAAANGCTSSGFSSQVWAYASGSGSTVRTGAPLTMMKPPTPIAKPQAVVAPVTMNGKYKLWASAGPSVGEVTLRWKDADTADNYHLVYGTASGKYQYGALNIGRVNQYTVKKLTPGVTYYFALVPVLNNMAKYTSAPVAGWAKGMEVITTSKENLMQPKVRSNVLPPKVIKEEVGLPSTSSPAAEQPTVPAGY